MIMNSKFTMRIVYGLGMIDNECTLILRGKRCLGRTETSPTTDEAEVYTYL